MGSMFQALLEEYFDAKMPFGLRRYADTEGCHPLGLPYIDHGSSFAIGTEWLQR